MRQSYGDKAQEWERGPRPVSRQPADLGQGLRTSGLSFLLSSQ
jgi:hypothetical protein